MATADQLLSDALAHHEAGRLGEAESLYRQVLAACPQHPDALHLLGAVAHQLGRSDAAVPLIRQAIAVRGDVAAFHNNLGLAYQQLGQLNEAVAAFGRAIALAPGFAEAHNSLGTVLESQGRRDAALPCYEAAIACRPEYANAHYNRARAWLAHGDFARGWPEYEWRWRRAEFRRPQLAEPEWDGAPLDGRTLLVRWEQGLGDTLQFIRYVRLLQDSGEKVIAEVQAALVPLLGDSGFRDLVTDGQPRPAFDVHAMFLSLPYRLGTSLETIPAPIPYLRASQSLVEKWKRRLDAVGGRFRVGIHWQGFHRSPLEPWRSMPLAAFAPLARAEGVKLISLQKGVATEQIAAVADAFDVVDWSAELDEQSGAFRDTAALMNGLDLVVTSDSATAHLAGALGVAVWVALPLAADYRWLENRSDSPWYPTMRLFRQRRLGEWSEVFDVIGRELDALVRSRGR